MIVNTYVCGEIHEVREDREDFVRAFPEVLEEDLESVACYGNEEEEVAKAWRCYRRVIGALRRGKRLAHRRPWALAKLQLQYVHEMARRYRIEVRQAVQAVRWERYDDAMGLH